MAKQFPMLLVVLGSSLFLCLITLGMPPATAAGPSGVPVLRDFEDLPIDTPIYNQYDGVTFIGGDRSNSDGSHTVTIIRPTEPTVSPTQALQSYISSSCEFCGTQLTMRFDQPQSQVSLSTGLAPQRSGRGPWTLLLQGFSQDPSTPGASPVVQSTGPCLGQGPTPLTTPLQVTDVEGRLTYAVLALVSCERPTDPISGGDNRVLRLDNLAYDRPLHPLPHEHDPPIVTIATPGNGTTIIGDVPGEIAVRVQATVTESAIASMTAQVNGGPPKPVTYFHTDPQHYNAMVIVDAKDGLVSGNNTVILVVRDFDRPSNTGTASTMFTFQIKPIPALSQVDIVPTAFEVTQSISDGPQGLGNRFVTDRGFEVRVIGLFDVPLLQRKPTVIRIYGAASGTTGPIKQVPALMDVSRDHCTIDCDIAKGLPPINKWSSPGIPMPNLAGITVPPFGAPDSTPNNVVPSLEKTWNFLLQPDWTARPDGSPQDLVATVHVNDGNYKGFPTRNPVDECIGGCFYNNEVKLHLHFQPPAEITVYPVYIHVTGNYRGHSYNDVKPDERQVDDIFTLLNEVFPIKVLRGSRYDITVSPDISKDDLLERIQNFSGFYILPGGINCQAKPLSYVFYIGLFPGDKSIPAHSFAAHEPKSDGSYTGGLAPDIGAPCSIPGAWSDADHPFTTLDVPHELAHNIGFDHWACENGVNNDECGVFPIPHGGIGGVGMDIANWRAIPPGDNSSNSTPHAHDFMTYGSLCGVPGCDLGEWVSWYTYQILVDHATVASYDTPDPLALLVSGRISSDGIATLRPIYQIGVTHPINDNIIEDDPEEMYTIRGYDSNGNTVLVHNFEPQKLVTHNPGAKKSLIFDEAIPVLSNLQRLVVLKGAQILGGMENPAPGQVPSVSISAPTGGNRWPIAVPQTIRWTSASPAGRPLTALVEYSPDGGKNRFTLGRDITGTSLLVNPDELAGSSAAVVYVHVTDGMNTAAAQSEPFAVAPKPPVVHIMMPQTNSRALAHVPLSLLGTAFSRQGTLADSQFRWSSSRDGVLGAGKQLTASHLSVGRHKLTLSVTDISGLTGQDSVYVRVRSSYQHKGYYDH